jgi:hypothetical protein
VLDGPSGGSEEPMSALRYSGELRIRVTYIDGWTDLVNGTPVHRNGEYRCAIRSTDKDAIRCTIIVVAPAVLSHAVDSPKAFDDAARAALAFASDEGWPVEEHAAYAADLSDRHIGRSPAKAWPVETSKAAQS